MKNFICKIGVVLLLTASVGYGSEPRNIILFVADGLRPSSVNTQDTPAFERVRSQGVRFNNSHSLFPTVTTANASAIATGHALGDSGNFANQLFVGYPLWNSQKPQDPATPIFPVKNNAILKDLNAHYEGNYLSEVSLLACAREHGFSTAAVGKMGPTLIQDAPLASLVGASSGSAVSTVIVDDATGTSKGVPLPDAILQAMQREGLPAVIPDVTHRTQQQLQQGNGSVKVFQPETPVADRIVQQRYFTDIFIKVILPEFEKAKKPFVAVYWCANPDVTQHNQKDSLYQFTPGINGVTSLAGVKNADANLGRILAYLDANLELAKSTNVIVVADHGFSTISKKWLNAERTQATSSYAAGFTYRDLKGNIVAQNGSLPLGFLAIDLAHALKMRLFDPDGTPVRQSGAFAYPEVDPVGRIGLSQYPIRGNGLIGNCAVVSKNSGAALTVVNSGGCDLIYLTNPNPELALRITSFLATQDYVGGIFVNKKQCGELPGALGLDQIHLEGTAKLPTPTMVVPFRNFALDAADPLHTQVSISNTTGREGQGSHGSFGRGDTFNFMAAMGPNFKKRYVDIAPVSNADVPITCAQILGLKLPSIGKLRGRVIREALIGGPEKISVVSGTLTSKPTSSGLATQVIYQDVGTHRYFDAGGFPGRTVGIH